LDEGNVGGVKILPITVRTLETLIRLSTAHAKLRLSRIVEVKDARVAVKLLYYSLFNDDNFDDDWKETETQMQEE